MEENVKRIYDNLDDIYEHLDQIGPDIAGIEIALKEIGYKYPNQHYLRGLIEDAMKELADVRDELDDYLLPVEEEEN